MANAITHTAAEQAFLDAFAKMEDASALRKTAAASFAETGLPHRRMEGWRWSDLRAVLREAPSAPGLPALAAAPVSVLDGEPCANIVISNGAAAVPPMENLSGVTAKRLSDALAGSDAGVGAIVPQTSSPLLDLNTALMSDGVVLHVAEGTEVQTPIEIDTRAMGGGGAYFTRNVIEVGAGASVTLIERTYDEGGAFLNTATELHIGEGATVRRYIVQQNTNDAVISATGLAKLAPGATLEQSAIAFGGKLVRLETYVDHGGEGAKLSLDGVSLLSGKRHADMTSFIHHGRPDGETQQRQNSVARDAARTVFQGKILVDRPAQRTDAQMASHALLLSDNAEADAKPELEIYADDVICAHGATSGDIDEEALFYMRARGIPAEAARGLLIEAFLAETIDDISHEPVREAFHKLASDWINKRGVK